MPHCFPLRKVNLVGALNIRGVAFHTLFPTLQSSLHLQPVNY